MSWRPWFRLVVQPNAALSDQWQNPPYFGNHGLPFVLILFRRYRHKNLREGIQVTISHPKIIETGIDLMNHSSLIFLQSGYSLHTLRQASRRSWRIGQRQPVRVFYLHYEEQSNCLRLMGKKLLVSLAMEGKFCRDGLQGLEQDDDMLTAMARELVTEKGIGESAAAVWRQIQTERSDVVPPATIMPEPTPVIEDPPVITPLVVPLRPDPAILNALRFGSRPQSTRPVRRRDAPREDCQFSLF
jgi:hypothetical protein